MSTDTPKTDSVSDFTVLYGAGPDTTLEYVPADFARQLERENAILQAKVHKLAEILRESLEQWERDLGGAPNTAELRENSFATRDIARRILSSCS